MKYREISGNHYEAVDGNAEVIGRIKAQLEPSGAEYQGIPLGEWVFKLYRVTNGEDVLIPTKAIYTLNQAKAVLEYHL